MDFSHPWRGILRESEGAILDALSRTTDGFTGRRLEQLIGATSHSAVLAALRGLVEVGLVNSRVVGRASVYTLNREHLLWEPVRNVLASRAELILRIDRMLRDRFPHLVTEREEATFVAGAIYGSTARRDSTASSDIDIVLIFEDDVASSDRESVVDQTATFVERITGNLTQIIDVDRSRLREMSRSGDPLVANWEKDATPFTVRDLRSLIHEPAPPR